jgi:hypothetical protein
MLSITCPHCQRRIELDDDLRGKPARCPRCAGIFRAPLEDGQPATATGRGGWARSVLIGSALLSFVGFLGTAGAILVRLHSGELFVEPLWVDLCFTLPIVSVALTWLLARQVDGRSLVFVTRLAAYLWLLCLLILRLKMM